MGLLAALLLLWPPVPALAVPPLTELTPPVAPAAPTTSPAVGALFSLTTSGALGPHFCTASVVDSPGGDVVLTAAHCLTQHTGATLAFVPGYGHGRAPHGVWRVAKTFVDRAWATSGDPDHDVAFFTVEPRRGRTVESVTGAERLGAGSSTGKTATVVGYPAASDVPISCSNALVAFSSTQLEFDCAGYTNGTSGSALVVDADPVTGLGTVAGVIGGYEEGGDTPDVSYAAAFGTATAALYRLAAASD